MTKTELKTIIREMLHEELNRTKLYEAAEDETPAAEETPTSPATNDNATQNAANDQPAEDAPAVTNGTRYLIRMWPTRDARKESSGIVYGHAGNLKSIDNVRAAIGNSKINANEVIEIIRCPDEKALKDLYTTIKQNKTTTQKA